MTLRIYLYVSYHYTGTVCINPRLGLFEMLVIQKDKIQEKKRKTNIKNLFHNTKHGAILLHPSANKGTLYAIQLLFSTRMFYFRVDKHITVMCDSTRINHRNT